MPNLFTNLSKLVDHCDFANSARTTDNDEDLIRRWDNWISGEKRTQLKFEGTKRGFGGRLDLGLTQIELGLRFGETNLEW